MPYSYLSHLECPRCEARHEAGIPQGLCSCGSPLVAKYDLDSVKKSVTRSDIAERAPSLWRYHELLPVADVSSVTTLGEGMTPLLQLPNLGKYLGIPNLLMKDEGTIPTGTFKARGAAVGVSMARQLGLRRLAMPTNGNAGAAWACYSARAGLQILIIMPTSAPTITRAECAASGADLFLVDGLISDAGAIVGRTVERDGYFDVSTLKEPYRLEGKKTMGIEIVEQLGWTMPDVIAYPTGGGVGIIGIYKALNELLTLGWVQGALPRLVAVQADGCKPIVKAFEEGRDTSEPWPESKTIAFGINVPKAIGDFLILQAVRSTNGCALSVSDGELLAAQQRTARMEGAFICPEGAAAVAAVDQLRQSGWIREREQVVVLNTGAGIKYPETVPVSVPILAKHELPPPVEGSDRMNRSFAKA